MGRLALDILNDLADALGWQQISTIEGDQTAYTRKMVRTLNRTLRTLSAIDDFEFLRAEGMLVTVAPYEVGAVTIANGSTLVTGVDDPNVDGVALPAWTTAMEGRAICVGTDALFYRIQTVTSPTTLTLSMAYQGDAVTAGNYTIAQDRYELPADFDRPIGDWTNFFSTSSLKMTPLSPNEFMDRRRRSAGGIGVGEPQCFTTWGMDDEQEHRIVVLDPFPDGVRVLQFPYQMVHPEITVDTDKVRFPLRYDPLLLEACLYVLKRDIEDDAQAGAMLMDFLAAKNNILAKREVGSEMKRISPHQGRRLAEYAKWGKNRTRKIDWGSAFDRVGFYDLNRWN